MTDDVQDEATEENVCINRWGALADDPDEARGACTWHNCDRWHREGVGECVCVCGSTVLSMPEAPPPYEVVTAPLGNRFSAQSLADVEHMKSIWTVTDVIDNTIHADGSAT